MLNKRKSPLKVASFNGQGKNVPTKYSYLKDTREEKKCQGVKL